MTDVTLIGLDLAKNVFQAHGVDAEGTRVWSRRLRRDGVGAFFARQPRGVVAMEACAGAHHWGRLLEKMGHEVRLIPAREVKPFVRLPKTDVSDAAAIAEAARRPQLRRVRGVSSDVRGAPGTRPVAAPHVVDQRAAGASGGVRHHRAGRRGGADPAVRAGSGAGDGCPA